MASTDGQSTFNRSLQGETFGLPAELFWMVIGYLTFADRFFLSKTSAALRRALQQDWRCGYPLFTHRDQRKICSELAEGLLNVWYCTPCGRLHRVDTDDYPGNPEWDPSGECTMNQKLPFHSFHATYPVQARHVQLARKLSRIQEACGSHIYDSYLKKLMEPWSVNDSLLPGEGAQFVPKYVDNQIMVRKTFLLEKEPVAPFSSLKDERFLFLSLCPHVDPNHCTAEAYSPWKHFKSQLLKALSRNGIGVNGFCPHCPTDYHMVIDQGVPTRLRVTAWCVLVLDPEYSATNWRKRRFVWNFQEHNYHPGRVRDAYQELQRRA